MRIENCRRHRLIRRRSNTRSQISVELHLAVRAGRTQVIRTGLPGICQFFSCQSLRKRIVNAQKWCAAAFLLHRPRHAVGPGDLNQFIKQAVKQSRCVRVGKPGDITGPQGMTSVMSGNIQIVEPPFNRFADSRCSDIVVKHIQEVSDAGFARIPQPLLGQGPVNLIL